VRTGATKAPRLAAVREDWSIWRHSRP